MRIAVMGAGAIGCIVGGHISRAGHDVTLIDQWPAHVEQIRTHGLRLSAPGGEHLAHPTALHLYEAQAIAEPFEAIFLAVKSYDTDWAVPFALRFLREPDGVVVVFQNGINDERVARLAGRHRTLGCVITIGAGLPEAGHAIRTDTNALGFKIGELDGRDTERARRLVEVVSTVATCQLTSNLFGERWSKMAVNCMANPVAGLSGLGTGEVLVNATARRLAISLAAEVITVGSAAGHAVEPIMGIPAARYVAAARGQGYAALEGELAALGQQRLGGRPSLLQDVLRGRRTEINELNGLIVAEGQRLGVPTPVNAAIVGAFARHPVGGFTPDPANLQPLLAAIPAPVTVSAGSGERRLRLGLIGTGLALERLHWPALRRLPHLFEIVGLADPDPDHSAHFASLSGLGPDLAVTDYRRLLERPDIDAVLIAVPIALNLPVARDCLQAGKHVLCEKPTGGNAEQLQAFLELERAHPDRVCLIAENFFYRDDLRLARTLLDEGIIGPPHLLSWRLASHLVPRPGQFSSTPWRIHPEYVGGPLLDANVHHLAQIRFLCGEVAWLHANTATANRTTGGPSDLTLNLTFASGLVGNFTAVHADTPVPGEDNVMHLYGPNGTMAVGQRRVAFHPAAGGGVEYHFDGGDGGYYNEWLDFHAAVVHGVAPTGTVGQSARTMQLVLDALESARTGMARPATTIGAAAPPAVWRPRGSQDPWTGLPTQPRQVALQG